MASVNSETTIQQLYIAYFGRPADLAGLAFYADALDAGSDTLVNMANSFALSVEAAAIVALDTNAFLTSFYSNAFGRAYNSDAAVDGTFWADAISAGSVTKEQAMVEIVGGASAVDGQIIQNKTTVATTYTTAVRDGDATYTTSEVAAAQAILTSVDESAASVDGGNAAALVEVATNTSSAKTAADYGADALATFDGNTYLVFESAKSYSDAQVAAEALQGDSGLVSINSAAENNFVFNLLQENNVTSTAADGSGVALTVYAWIDGSDAETEGVWLDADGVELSYTNWGSKDGFSEPDNYDSTQAGRGYTGQQDYAALALTDWPIGVAGQWNDVDGVNSLAYVVEIIG